MNDRMQAYLNGELSLDEARALEAELAQQGAEMDPAVIEDKVVGDAWRALDARERVVKRRRVPVALWVALAAAVLLATWFAWPRSEPVKIAAPTLPPVVIPVHQEADRELVESGDVVQVAVSEVMPEAGPEDAPKVAGGPDESVGAVNGEALEIDLRTSTLGLGPEARMNRSTEGRERVTKLVVRAHPQVEDLVNTGLLDWIVRCADNVVAVPMLFKIDVRRPQLEVDTKMNLGLKMAPFSDRGMGECVQGYRADAAWQDTKQPFEVHLDSAPFPDLGAEPSKSPIKDPTPKEPKPIKGKLPSKGKKDEPYKMNPSKGGKGNPYDSD